MTLLALGSLALFTVSRLWGPPVDIDLWWHLKTGEVIWQAGFVPGTDIFSYTGFGNEWINHEWGCEVVLYLLRHYLGTPGIVAFRWLTGLLTVWCLYQTGYWLSRQRAVSLLLASAAFWIAALRYADRPSMVSTLGMCAVLWLVTGVRTGAFRRRAYLWLFAMFPLWANLHGGVVLGLEVLLLCWLPDLLRRVWRRLPAPRWYLREELLFPLLLVAVLANPFGYRVLTFPFENLHLTVAIAHTMEWLSPFHPAVTLMSDAGWIPYIFLLIGAGVFLTRHPPHLSYLLVVGLTALMASRAARFVAEFACAAAPVLTVTCAGWIARWRLAWLPVAACYLTLVGHTAWKAVHRGSIEHQQQRLMASERPYFSLDLMLFLNAQQISGRVFNDINLGSSFIFMRGPREKVFFDGRHNIYGNQFYRDYLETFNSMRFFEAQSARYGGFDYILLGNVDWQRHLKLHRYLWGHPDWAMVYTSPKGYIYLRRKPEFAEVIRQYRITTPPARLWQRIPFLPSEEQ